MTDTAREAVARAIEAELFRVQELDTKRGIITPERVADSAISAFTAWLQENGWQIVPKEPSEAMIDAGDAADHPAAPYSGYATEHASCETHYRAMLAAAPKLESDR